MADISVILMIVFCTIGGISVVAFWGLLFYYCCYLKETEKPPHGYDKLEEERFIAHPDDRFSIEDSFENRNNFHQNELKQYGRHEIEYSDEEKPVQKRNTLDHEKISAFTGIVQELEDRIELQETALEKALQVEKLEKENTNNNVENVEKR